MTHPSILETRAQAIAEALRDYARDLEARLSVVTRNRFVNPNDYTAMAFAPPSLHRDSPDVVVTNIGRTEDILARYHQGAGSAVTPIEGHDDEENPLTPSQKAAFKAVYDLVAAIQAVTTYGEASALVASFK